MAAEGFPLQAELAAGGALGLEDADFEIDLLATGQGHGVDDRRSAILLGDLDDLVH